MNVLKLGEVLAHDKEVKRHVVQMLKSVIGFSVMG